MIAEFNVGPKPFPNIQGVLNWPSRHVKLAVIDDDSTNGSLLAEHLCEALGLSDPMSGLRREDRLRSSQSNPSSARPRRRARPTDQSLTPYRTTRRPTACRPQGGKSHHGPLYGHLAK